MTVANGLDYINYIINKESSGGVLTPIQYNTLLNSVNIELFNDKLGEFQKYLLQVPKIEEAILVFKGLQEFRLVGTVNFSSGIASIPSNFAFWIKMITTYNNQQREISILSDNEFAQRRTNLLAPKITEYPIGRVVGGQIQVLPNNILSAEFVYFSQPSTPFYDYYIDAYGNPVSLNATNSPHALLSGETGSSGQTSGSVSSQTVELAWNIDYHMEFFNAILKKVGINIANQAVEMIAKDAEGREL
jgi:hypothetical protein